MRFENVERKTPTGERIMFALVYAAAFVVLCLDLFYWRP